MPISPAQRRAKDKYDAKTYSFLATKPKIAEAELIRSYAKSRGESLTRFIVRATTTQMRLDAEQAQQADQPK